MKNLFKTVLVSFFVFLLVGCSSYSEHEEIIAKHYAKEFASAEMTRGLKSKLPDDKKDDFESYRPIVGKVTCEDSPDEEEAFCYVELTFGEGGIWMYISTFINKDFSVETGLDPLSRGRINSMLKYLFFDDDKRQKFFDAKKLR